MQIVIHRGTSQIGGCCTEIRTDKARIFIDLGQELPGPGIEPRPLQIDGLTCGAANCDGVFFTHYHGDHVGLYGSILPGIPLYMGRASKDIFLVLQTHLATVSEEIKGNLPKLEAVHTFQVAKPIGIGDIKITPYFTDHSAYDAYMFLIEADGKRVLHTGDFRMHGYLGKGMLPTMEKWVGRVDLLITEGTALSRPAKEPETEYELQKKLHEYMKQCKNVFLLCSSTNIDRLASLQASAKKFHRLFICDAYQRDVLDIVTHYGGDKSPLYRFDRVKTYGKNLDELMDEKGFCMPIRASEKFRPFLEKYQGEDTILLYSMWKGYLTQNPAITQMVEGRPWEYLHTSGHASPQGIKKLCAVVRPKTGIIPIHTEAAEAFDRLCEPYKIIHQKDEEEYTL